MARFDLAADRALDSLRGHPAADRLFYLASELGDFGLIWLILGALRGLRGGRDWNAALRIAAGLGLESVLINVVVKSLFRRSRPPWEVDRPHPLRRPRTSSFPSGHATSAFSAAALLADGDDLGPLYYAVAVVVATSRVYVRIHHASDVVGGVAIGVILGQLGRRLVPLPPVSPASR
ncbi:MAG: phosphatase PAP2 family protein [Acidimicrobiales bacterium]